MNENEQLPENNKKSKFSNTFAIICFLLFILLAFMFLILGLTLGLGFWALPYAFVLITSLVLFCIELKKMPITQEDLDEWNNQILAKHPNFNQDMLMKLEDVKKITNRFSYWTHTFKISATKVLACIALPLAFCAVGVGVVAPIASGRVGGTGTDIVGIYISNSPNAVVVTAYNFRSDDTYQLGSYDRETKKYTWHSSGKYTKSGSTITIKAGTFTIKNGGKQLQDNYGNYWIKV